MPGPVAPRAVGQRVEFDALPSRVLAWLEGELGGRVVAAATQTGGMSPGPASRIVLDTGDRFFVKAVGAELNPHAPRLFRREIRVLSALPAVDYRPSMVASYDDGDWVAIVLEDVEGHHPNLSDRAVMDAARRVVRAQSRELTPNPLRVESETLAGSVHRWYDEIAGVGPAVHPLLPRWWLAHETDLLARIATLPARLPAESWCHFDVRDDNLLVRPDGSVVIVDWGMSRPGPAWVDEMLLELHNITHTAFDEHVARIPAYGVASDHGRYDAVTDFVLALGMSLAVIAHEPVEEGLPRLNSFRRAESKRLLTGAGRRLQLG